MHIPEYMLNGRICPVTAGMAVLGVAAATYFAVRSKEKPSAGRFAAVSALIFASQMMNFPVLNGTSGHLIGGVLAASILGTPFGILALTLVLTIQSLIFSDGGLTTLGANVLNMGIIGAGLSGIALKLFNGKNEPSSVRNYLVLGIVSWFSVMAASFACGLELAIAKTAEFSKVMPAMLSVHALIGIGEAVLTVGLFILLNLGRKTSNDKIKIAFPLTAAVVTSALLSPFASRFPDGLESVAEKYRFLHESAPAFAGFMPDYVVPFIKSEAFSTGLAGLIGVAITFAAVYVVGRLIRLAGKGTAESAK